MKFLLDENFPKSLSEKYAKAGIDLRAVRENGS